MKDTKSLAMMFLLGAFVTGGALGFSANGYMNRDRICTTGSYRNALLAIMSKRLKLSPSQASRVDSILDDRGRQYRVVMSPIQARMDSIKLNSREQIRLVLNPVQIREFEALITEMSDTTSKTRDE